MILINDIFKIDDLKYFKIKLNQGIDNNPAIEVFLNNKNRYKKACAWNGKNVRANRPKLITFAKIQNKSDLWLFTGVYNVLNYNEKNIEMSEIEEDINYQKYSGRLIIKYHKSIQQYVLKAENILDKIYVHQIMDSEYNDMFFKGYQNVLLSLKQLKHIISTQNDTWKTALENVKGVYLITNNLTGQMYVGSAYGDKMLWGRWSNYAKNGHGGDVKLMSLIQDEGMKYAEDHLYFSILEHFPSSVSDVETIPREEFWKMKLMTRKFGYN